MFIAFLLSPANDLTMPASNLEIWPPTSESQQLNDYLKKLVIIKFITLLDSEHFQLCAFILSALVF
jgi:hypothetical protein